MPPKMKPLYCLVHGDIEDYVFGIKYDKNTTVDELRDLIKDKLSPSLDHVSVKDLTIYQVSIDLTTQNPQRAALGNLNANIVNDLGGQELTPMDTLGEQFPEPANKHIHVIVEVPVFPGTAGKWILLLFIIFLSWGESRRILKKQV
jgi:hypothetical protein